MVLSHLTGPAHPAHFNSDIKIHVLISLLWGIPVHIGVEISVPLKEELFFFFTFLNVNASLKSSRMLANNPSQRKGEKAD